ncbi:MAG: glycosyltransferase family 2 protein [Alphaproteobacteria bacterium]|nr:glycosyltransferase family 2 protein [Alphaproteobacteria bacterium]MCB9974421.1 glycosyltransferase family 2 protein [Rhodospirillales bacterium]
MGEDSKLSTLTIGIPVHDEERSLPDSYASLVEAINRLPKYVQVEVIYCVNGCTDKSEHILRNMTQGSRRMDDFKVIESEPGKMNAQKAIVANRRFKDGPICFADADILMGHMALAALYKKLTDDPECMVSYAHVEPYYDGESDPSLSAFPDLLFTHYNYRKHQPPRSYFHGRTFMMRDAHHIEEMGLDLDKRVARVMEMDPWFVEHLHLEDGPLVDDIYLSRVIVAEHGVDAIVEVPEAQILFHPPTTVEDFFHVIDRTRTEIKRLDLLYPEHAPIQKEHFRRAFEDASIYMPEGERMKLRLLREIEDAFSRRIDEGLMSPTERKNPLAQTHWVHARTTKQSFGLVTDSFLSASPDALINQGLKSVKTGDVQKGPGLAEVGAHHQDKTDGGPHEDGPPMH